mmetsp:Transcript_5764/g.17006  ORF Transcript_5764/g.17006 Transcript_5764/m.17006 type:complete len:92 (-) Transcript_5764:40-315(-)
MRGLMLRLVADDVADGRAALGSWFRRGFNDVAGRSLASLAHGLWYSVLEATTLEGLPAASIWLCRQRLRARLEDAGGWQLCAAQVIAWSPN